MLPEYVRCSAQARGNLGFKVGFVGHEVPTFHDVGSGGLPGNEGTLGDLVLHYAFSPETVRRARLVETGQGLLYYGELRQGATI